MIVTLTVINQDYSWHAIVKYKERLHDSNAFIRTDLLLCPVFRAAG
jgi:hypothetical protein